MATIIKNTSSDNRSTSKFVVAPVMDGMTGFFYPSDTVDLMVRNLVFGGNDAEIVGDPTVNDGYMTAISGSDYLQTDIAETNDFTIFGVARTDAILTGADIPAIASNFTTGHFGSSLMYFQNGSLPAGFVRGETWYFITDTNTLTPTNRVLSDVTTWIASYFKISGLVRKVADLTHDVSQIDNTAGGSTRVLSDNETKFRIGSIDGKTAELDIAHVSFYNRALTDQELYDQYAFVKTYLATKGIDC